MLRKLYKILFLPYLLVLLYMMFFGFGRLDFYEENIVRLEPIISTIKFAERSLLFSRFPMFLLNLFGNIFAFSAFGFLGWLYPKFNDFCRLLIFFLSAIVIVEALQYFTRLGVFDIDDIILNTLGVIIGFWLKQKLEKYFSIPKSINSNS